jgi:hypothetical protein
LFGFLTRGFGGPAKDISWSAKIDYPDLNKIST